MVICLERNADVHMAQLMPLTVSCFSKIQTGFTFLVVPEKGPLNGCVCVLYYKYIVQFAGESFFYNQCTFGKVIGKMVDCVICLICRRLLSSKMQKTADK